MMKRRNVDCVKPRRPLKRNKISEGFYGSTVVYIKFFMMWLIVLGFDYIMEFRFEYLWPFWLLLRSVYDSFRYQGLAFCVLFLCMAITADMVAIVFIPASWLFFAASTYVWVTFVWHTERGVCMPTIVLWVIFIYVEVMVRLKDFKNVPFHMDLCRPFAAHCIGYPVVTLGFGLKSYVGYRLRQRKQREVARENEFYVQLLQEALPPDLQHIKNLSTAATHATAAVLKEYEDNEGGELDAIGPVNSSSAGVCNPGISRGVCASTRSVSAATNTNISSGRHSVWSKDCSGLPSSISFLSRLLTVKGSISTTASATAGVGPLQHTSTGTSWWKSWLTKPDNIYKNGSSHTINSCLVNNIVSSSSTSSSCSSSSSSCSSSSSTSSSSSSCSTNRRNNNSGDGGGSLKSHIDIAKDISSSAGPGLPLVTPNGTAVQASTGSTSGGGVGTKHSKVPNNSLHAQLEYMQKQSVSARSVNNFDGTAVDQDKTVKSNSNNGQAISPGLADPVEKQHNKNKSNTSAATQHQQSNGSAKVSVTHTNNIRNDTGTGTGSKKNKNKDTNRDTTTPARDDSITIIKLESELKRTRSELSSSRSAEQELRNQVNTLVSGQKMCQQELAQVQQDNDTLQNKLHGLVTARQSDRVTLGGLERRVAEERRGRQSAEAQLQQLERRARKLEEQNQQQQQRQQQQQSKCNSGECSESCRNRRADLEAELKRLRREYRMQEEKARTYERENVALRQYKESQNDNEVLMSALAVMQDRNAHLETSLSSETRVKLDLFSALGEAKRQLTIAQEMNQRKDKEIEELKAKVSEVLAVCPATSFSSTSLHTNASGPHHSYHYSSNLLMPQLTSDMSIGGGLPSMTDLRPRDSIALAVSNSLESSRQHHNLMTDFSMESLVVNLGFPASPPPVSPSVQLHPLVPPLQQQPISPPTPGPISPPSNSGGMSSPPPPHSSLDPNARIYTPKGVNGAPQLNQDN